MSHISLFLPIISVNLSKSAQPKDEDPSGGQGNHAVHDQLIINSFDVITTAAAAACNGSAEECSSRHKTEKEKLMGRLARDQGTWNANHPRWRLLKAIDGFRSYRDANKAEVDRWREAYRHVGKDQKKVSRPDPARPGPPPYCSICISLLLDSHHP